MNHTPGPAKLLKQKENEFLALVPPVVKKAHEGRLSLTRNDFIKDVFFSKLSEMVELA